METEMITGFVFPLPSKGLMQCLGTPCHALLTAQVKFQQILILFLELRLRKGRKYNLSSEVCKYTGLFFPICYNVL